GVAGLAKETAATPFMVLLAAFTALLARHSGQLDLVVGSPIAGRTHAETEPLIGLFLNPLALRADLSGDPPVHELVRRMREVTLGAYAHQELPFEKLVEDLSPERDLSHAPVFQVLLVLQNVPFEAREIPGLRIRPVEHTSINAKLDLVLNATEADGGLSCRWIYNSDLFDAPRIARLRGHFANLLEAALADSGRRLSDLPLLGAAERWQILGEWGDTATAYPTGVTLHELIAAQADRTPDTVAVTAEGESLTYRDLLDRSRSLARHLRSLGVQPDGQVGVLAERSLEMIVGLLGTLLAGAAYVPLDPTLPSERLALLIESAGIGVVLTQERHAKRLPGQGERTVLLDRSNAFHQFPVGRTRVEERSPGEAGLAYVLYTSGSTGTPKGVMIPHRGIVNRLLWMQEAYALTPADRVLQKTPFSFDVSLWEFFWPLLVGARLVFAKPEGHKDPRYLVELIACEEITTLHFVPSMLQAFLAAPGLEELTSVRKVMASGEALPPEMVRQFFQRMPHAELHNLYGPTEASVDVSFWACEPEPPRGLVPIGRPIANHRLHVVDPHLGPQPIGVPGELLLGGPGLARGYLGRPDLTAAAFVPDPFGTEPGGRLYRTGDLVTRLPDGNVLYLGRIDHQVKVRGFRIEPGEVEAVLAAHPAVRQAVVGLRGTGTAQRLIAWVVCDAESPDPADRLRGHLQARLPEYMIPAGFVPVASLPRTPSGKIDRRALPDPEPAPSTGPEPAAPRTPLDEYLAGLWREALAVDSVGLHDSFFDLGGNSISGAILINRLQREIGGIIHIATLFDAPTVAKMADYLVREEREAVVRLWGAAALGAEAAPAPKAAA
ncbi:MAG TPA: amino acid adenylation domain-containing protein, partial [Thermoanaerobaculia bacterium]|nr:amino acid adenylation domain-containing protein [Thermoanaerobaculia bacterium]